MPNPVLSQFPYSGKLTTDQAKDLQLNSETGISGDYANNLPGIRLGPLLDMLKQFGEDSSVLEVLQEVLSGVPNTWTYSEYVQQHILNLPQAANLIATDFTGGNLSGRVAAIDTAVAALRQTVKITDGAMQINLEQFSLNLQSIYQLMGADFPENLTTALNDAKTILPANGIEIINSL